MRQWISILTLAFLIGCGGNTAYKTFGALGHTYNAAYSAYMDGVVKGAIRTNDVPKVAELYKETQTIYAASLAVAQFNPDATPPSNVVAKASELVTAIGVAKGAKK